MQLARDAGVVLASIAVVMVVLFLALGTWPPMVVIESGSMMHGRDSSIGVIDTGDLTLVKAIGDRTDVVTWAQGNPDLRFTWVRDGVAMPEQTITIGSGHQTYGLYGDVIIYRKNNQPTTPVIHRAMLWMEGSSDPGCPGMADLPDLKLTCVESIEFIDATIIGSNFKVNLLQILQKGTPFGGFITKGDNNNRFSPHGTMPAALSDQESLTVPTPSGSEPVHQVAPGWVVGKAVGELPSFGLLRLLVTKQVSLETAPPSSVRFLALTLIVLVGVPLALDLYSGMRARRARKAELQAQQRALSKGKSVRSADSEE